MKRESATETLKVSYFNTDPLFKICKPAAASGAAVSLVVPRTRDIAMGGYWRVIKDDGLFIETIFKYILYHGVIDPDII